jgi:hypothetical protein
MVDTGLWDNQIPILIMQHILNMATGHMSQQDTRLGYLWAVVSPHNFGAADTTQGRPIRCI